LPDEARDLTNVMGGLMPYLNLDLFLVHVVQHYVECLSEELSAAETDLETWEERKDALLDCLAHVKNRRKQACVFVDTAGD
jgi:hypothetical protein